MCTHNIPRRRHRSRTSGARAIPSGLPAEAEVGASRHLSATAARRRDTLEMASRDFETEQQEYRPGLRLRSLEFINDDEIEVTFEGIATSERTWRVRRSVHGGIPLINWDEEFNNLYRGVPLVSCGHSLDALVNQAWASRDDQLPIEESWERVFEEGKEQLARRWAETHPEPD